MVVVIIVIIILTKAIHLLYTPISASFPSPVHTSQKRDASHAVLFLSNSWVIFSARTFILDNSLMFIGSVGHLLKCAMISHTLLWGWFSFFFFFFSFNVKFPHLTAVLFFPRIALGCVEHLLHAFLLFKSNTWKKQHLRLNTRALMSLLILPHICHYSQGIPSIAGSLRLQGMNAKSDEHFSFTVMFLSSCLVLLFLSPRISLLLL